MDRSAAGSRLRSAVGAAADDPAAAGRYGRPAWRSSRFIVVTAALVVALARGCWLLPVASAVALPVIVVAAGQSTPNGSPQSLAVGSSCIFSVPLLFGAAIGFRLRAALRCRRRCAH